jgi:GTP-binding protein HflX
MPQDLFTAFKATFDEARDADLLVHVLDVSNPESADQEQTTEQLLDRLELEQKPRLTVLNKADLLPDAPTANVRGSDNVFISAASGWGIDDLLGRISEIVVPRLGFSPPPSSALGADAPQGVSVSGAR